ncbi:MAG: aldo/keto reductase family protein [Fimbriimonas sp.]
MRYRRLGRYGVRVSEVALGGWLTHGRTLDDSATEGTVRRALDLGINFFDTADVYNRGEAELALGRALHGTRREEHVIATKCFFPMSDGPNDRGLSRKHITESVNASLRRLRTDYVDLMQFHRFDAETPLDETVRAIDDLVRAGKVLYWGVSEWQAEQISDLVAVAERLNANPPASNQPRYNMLVPHIERAILPTCGRHGLGLVVFSPLAQGILTGKYEPGQPPPAGSRGADETSNNFMKDSLNDETLTRVQRLKTFANEQGHTLASFALAWCLRKPEVSSVIIGATTPEQVEANVAGSGIELPADVWAQAEAILAGTEA